MMKYRILRFFLASALLCCFCCAAASAQEFQSIEKNFAQHVTVKTLPNGLTLIVCDRPGAPVFSFFTIVDAGSVQDPKGDTGLAHMFEHLAGKGT